MLCSFRTQQLSAVASNILLSVQTILLLDGQTKQITDVSQWPIAKIKDRIAAVRSPEHAATAFSMFTGHLRSQDETKNIDRLLYELCAAHIEFMSLRNTTGNASERMHVPSNTLERLWNFSLRVAAESPNVLFVNDDCFGANLESFRSKLTSMFCAVCLMP